MNVLESLSPLAHLRAPSKRLTVLLLAVVVIAVIGRFGVVSTADVHAVRAQIAAMGPLGVVAMIALFSIGTWLWVPGLLLVTLSVMIYGPVLGAVISILGGLLAMNYSFLAIRTLSGKTLDIPDQRILRFALERLEARPVMWVALLRALFWLSPITTSALAVSPIRYRDYALGALIGFPPAVVFMVTVLHRSMTM
ncbi:MAG: VTT domain-containing protein [Acidobacteriota bacterium]